jgi:hypothetical protein
MDLLKVPEVLTVRSKCTVAIVLMSALIVQLLVESWQHTHQYAAVYWNILVHNALYKFPVKESSGVRSGE